MQQSCGSGRQRCLRHWWKNLQPPSAPQSGDGRGGRAALYRPGDDMADAGTVVLDGLEASEKDQRLLMLLRRSDRQSKTIHRVLNQMQKEDTDQPLLSSTLGQFQPCRKHAGKGAGNGAEIRLRRPSGHALMPPGWPMANFGISEKSSREGICQRSPH